MATLDATQKYKSRFTNLSDDFFSNVDGLFLSSVGMGSFAPESYREENYTYSFKDTIKEGVKLADACKGGGFGKFCRTTK